MYWMYPCLASSNKNPAGFLISMFSKTIRVCRRDTPRARRDCAELNHSASPSISFSLCCTCIAREHLKRALDERDTLVARFFRRDRVFPRHRLFLSFGESASRRDDDIFERRPLDLTLIFTRPNTRGGVSRRSDARSTLTRPTSLDD